MSKIIKNGIIATADDIFKRDVYVENGIVRKNFGLLRYHTKIP